MPSTATCGQCKRARTPQDPDYDPITVALYGRVGWYSDEHCGEVCPEEMVGLLELANPSFAYRVDVEVLS